MVTLSRAIGLKRSTAIYETEPTPTKSNLPHGDSPWPPHQISNAGIDPDRTSAGRFSSTKGLPRLRSCEPEHGLRNDVMVVPVANGLTTKIGRFGDSSANAALPTTLAACDAPILRPCVVVDSEINRMIELSGVLIADKALS